MGYEIKEMNIDNYDEVYALWKTSKGIALSSADSREHIARLLEMNPGLSFVVMDNGRVIGAVLCSQDGRLGYLTHLVVDKDYRRQGLGRSLVGRCLFALMGMGIQKCTLLIMEDNAKALAFWKKIGLSGRVDLVMMSARSP